MLERDVCDTERSDTEPVMAFVFMLSRVSCGRARRVVLSRAVVFVVKTLYAKLLR